MSKSLKNSFIKGALILAIANIITKIIGAFFKIPLANLIGDDGMGIFNSAYQIYIFMFIIATSGFPVAISKMVAENVARNNTHEVKKIFRISLIVLLIIGGIGTSVMFFASSWLASTLSNSRASYAILGIAPAVVYVAVMSAFRGYFQGMQNMTPTAISGVLEALGKLLIGYILAKSLMPSGVEFAAAGAVYGVVCGAAAGMIVLFITYLFRKRERIMGHARPSSSIFKELLFLTVPITLSACISSITSLIDTFTIQNRLQQIVGVTETAASSLYGAYSGFVIPIFQLPVTVIQPLAICLVPAIASAIAQNHKNNAKVVVENCLRFTFILGLACTIGFAITANGILRTIYTSPSDITVTLLQILAPSTLFISLLQVTTGTLQAYGKTKLPVIYMAIGGAVKLILNYTLIPVYGITIVPIATDICYFIIISLSLVSVFRVAELAPRWNALVLRPLMANIVLAIVAFGIQSILISNAFPLKGATILTIIAAAFAYFISIFAFKAITAEDIYMLPHGEKILPVLKKLRLV
ncbi:MAG: polysaccharide biosynthesis protein [Clostridiales bacterium]|jgi:stage V sporulation protein B|nr:polysaccharide biosynthesis protein [Clostridiales bacterium]